MLLSKAPRSVGSAAHKSSNPKSRISSRTARSASCIQRSRRTCATAVCIAFAVSKFAVTSRRAALTSAGVAPIASANDCTWGSDGCGTSSIARSLSLRIVDGAMNGKGPSPTRSAKRAPWTMFIARSCCAACSHARADRLPAKTSFDRISPQSRRWRSSALAICAGMSSTALTSAVSRSLGANPSTSSIRRARSVRDSRASRRATRPPSARRNSDAACASAPSTSNGPMRSAPMVLTSVRLTQAASPWPSAWTAHSIVRTSANEPTAALIAMSVAGSLRIGAPLTMKKGQRWYFTVRRRDSITSASPSFGLYGK